MLFIVLRKDTSVYLIHTLPKRYYQIWITFQSIFCAKGFLSCTHVYSNSLALHGYMLFSMITRNYNNNQNFSVITEVIASLKKRSNLTSMTLANEIRIAILTNILI